MWAANPHPRHPHGARSRAVDLLHREKVSAPNADSMLVEVSGSPVKTAAGAWYAG